MPDLANAQPHGPGIAGPVPPPAQTFGAGEYPIGWPTVLDVAQLDPPPNVPTRGAYMPEVVNRPRRDAQLYPDLNGAHGIVPDGPVKEGDQMAAWESYVPRTLRGEPLESSWDCESVRAL